LANRASNDCLHPGESARADAKRLPSPFQVLGIEVKEVAHLPDRDPRGIGSDAIKAVARSNLALFQDAQVETHPATGQELLLESFQPQLQAELVARDARLGHFDQRAAHAKDVAYIAVGNRAEALRVYERCRCLLSEELGVTPSSQTEAVYLDILRS
jgi:hypothetical protein